MASNSASSKEVSTEDKLKALYDLQQVYSEIDKIRTLRGELPLEVEDLEDEVQGLQTRIENLEDDIKGLTDEVSAKKNEIKEADLQIKKYESQQDSVRNNREYDAISKEIEFQNLSKQLCEKRIKEYSVEVKSKKELCDENKERLNERMQDLESKRAELDNIIAETQADEDALLTKAEQISSAVNDEYLLSAFNRIRSGARNGLAGVTVQRDACGGCFNKIPPQRQLDIRLHKKVIVCEYCGRVLVDEAIKGDVE